MKLYVGNQINESKLVRNRVGNVYVVYLDISPSNIENCLIASIAHNSWLWHNRLGHASMHILAKLSKNDLVKGLAKIKYEKIIRVM